MRNRYGIPEMLEAAEAIARECHAEHVDKAGAPYMGHVERVAAKFGEGSPIERIVAWLHDVIEDGTDVDRERVYSEMPPRIARHVLKVTRMPGHETYAEFIEDVATYGDAVALRVKLSDVADHLRDTAAIPASMVKRYRRAHAVLFAAAAKNAAEGAAIY